MRAWLGDIPEYQAGIAQAEHLDAFALGDGGHLPKADLDGLVAWAVCGRLDLCWRRKWHSGPKHAFLLALGFLVQERAHDYAVRWAAMSLDLRRGKVVARLLRECTADRSTDMLREMAKADLPADEPVVAALGTWAQSPSVTLRKYALRCLDNLGRRPMTAPLAPTTDDVATARWLSVWRETEDPRVAAHLRQLPEVRLTPAPGLGQGELAEWWARVWEQAPAARAGLLKMPWPASWKLGFVRLRAMIDHPDPRAVAALATLYDTYRSAQAITFWQKAGEVFSRWATVDQRDLVRPIVGQLGGCPHALTVYLQSDEAALAERRSPRALTPAERAELQTGAQQPKADLEGLLAAIWANPEDLAARAVYADALIEVGDPRGEFIQLQLDGSAVAARRARGLLAKHGKAWADPIGAGLLANHRSYKNGFLVGGAWARLTALDCRAWDLVETVRFAPRSPDETAIMAPLLAARRLPRLTAIHGLNGADVQTLLPAYRTSLASLAFRSFEDDFVLSDLPQLRELTLSYPSPRLLRSVLTLPLNLLVVNVGYFTRLGMPVYRQRGEAEVVMLAPRLASLGPDPEGWSIRFTRGRDGAYRQGDVLWNGGPGHAWKGLMTLLQPSVVQDLTLFCPKNMPGDLRERASQRVRDHGGKVVDESP